ncbi:hypothetical protein BDK92_0001 [Micromonospora pisi]|uniref:Uncharacterized protein n=1 Tax=Micromonospora pisi TaxID=589240 RepID=A0A495JBP9_9ACTN|nr:hypothetical protein [Micromonospora pisi]RKR85792.1 hypothetical protein BDK92_0001 [Micromonospora pisi]
MPRILVPLGAATGVAGSLLSVVVPWAMYGSFDIPLTRFPGWQVYAASVLALHSCVTWALLVPAGRRSVLPLVVGAASGFVAAGSAMALAFRYDDGSALFPGVVPAVWPTPGPGPAVALLAIALAIGAVLASRHRSGPTRTGSAVV